MSSDPNLFGVVADGTYDVNRIGSKEKRGPYNSVWTLNKRGNVPAMNNFNPAYPKMKCTPKVRQKTFGVHHV